MIENMGMKPYLTLSCPKNLETKGWPFGAFAKNGPKLKNQKVKTRLWPTENNMLRTKVGKETGAHARRNLGMLLARSKDCQVCLFVWGPKKKWIPCWFPLKTRKKGAPSKKTHSHAWKCIAQPLLEHKKSITLGLGPVTCSSSVGISARIPFASWLQVGLSLPWDRCDVWQHGQE